MPHTTTLVVDDSAANFKYAGDWENLAGSSRQWEAAVHSTHQSGASVSFRFRGSGFRVQGTIPAGNGDVSYEIIIDGVSSGILKQAGGAQNVYDSQFYYAPAPQLQDFVHTVVIVNRGSQADLSLQFDRVVLEALDVDPTITTPPPDSATTTASTSSSTSSTTPTTSSTTSTTTSGSSTTSSSRSTSFSQSSATGSISGTSLTATPSGSLSLITTTDQDGRIITTQVITTLGAGSVSPTGNGNPATSAVGASRSATIPLGALIGGILGALLVVILVFLLLRRRQKQKYLGQHFELKDDSAEKRGGVLPTPFNLPPNPDALNANNAQDRGQNPFTEKAALRMRDTPESGAEGGQSSSGHGSTNVQQAPSASTNPTTEHTTFHQAYTSAAQTSSGTAALSHRHSASIHVSSDDRLSGSQADYRLRYLSGDTAVVNSPSVGSMYGETARMSAYDLPPAYQATLDRNGPASSMGPTETQSLVKQVASSTVGGPNSS